MANLTRNEWEKRLALVGRTPQKYRDSLLKVLNSGVEIKEAEDVLTQLHAGHIDGLTYWGRVEACGCLYGTIGRMRFGEEAMWNPWKMDGNLASLPGKGTASGLDVESWFTHIHLGDTPANNAAAAFAASVIEEWLTGRDAKFAVCEE